MNRNKPIPPAARRALQEAEERRLEAQKAEKKNHATPKEIGGRNGPEPTRFGDWEKDGILSDF